MTEVLEVAVNVTTHAAGVVEKTDSATEAIQSGLHKVKVSRYDADQLERELQGELFDKWDEKCEVMKSTKILAENIIPFLDHMKDAYKGIDDDTLLKMKGIKWVEGAWEFKLLEYKLNAGKDSEASYGLIAFGKSPDKKYYDCMYVHYNMEFKLSQKTELTDSPKSILWGLLKWTTTTKEVTDRKLGSKSTRDFQNFFRLKAMQGFYKEGVIEHINYVESLDDVPVKK